MTDVGDGENAADVTRYVMRLFSQIPPSRNATPENAKSSSAISPSGRRRRLTRARAVPEPWLTETPFSMN